MTSKQLASTVVSLLLAAGAWGQDGYPIRSWTIAHRGAVQGRYVKTAGSIIAIEGVDGEKISVSGSLLSSSDRAYLQSIGGSAGNSPTANRKNGTSAYAATSRTTPAVKVGTSRSAAATLQPKLVVPAADTVRLQAEQRRMAELQAAQYQAEVERQKALIALQLAMALQANRNAPLSLPPLSLQQPGSFGVKSGFERKPPSIITAIRNGDFTTFSDGSSAIRNGDFTTFSDGSSAIRNGDFTTFFTRP